MTQGIVHQIERNRDGSYSVTCGTVLDSIDAAVTNWRFLTCGWCLKEASAHATLARMPTVPASPAMDMVMEAIESMDFPPNPSNGPALLGTDY